MAGRSFHRAAMDRDVRCRFEGADTWVRLYDLSAGGAMIELAGPGMAIDDEVELTFSDLVSVTGTIVWKIGHNAGVRFESVLSDWMLERLGVGASSYPFEDTIPRDRFGEPLVAQKPEPAPPPAPIEVPGQREPRLETNIPVRLAKTGGELVAGQLTNLASNGCRFADRTAQFKPGDVVAMRIGNLEEWPGTVRWAMEGEAGIEFDRPLHPAVVDHLRRTSAPEQPDR